MSIGHGAAATGGAAGGDVTDRLDDVQALEIAVRNLQMSRAIPMESMFC